jgi:hypothetical protein
MRELPPFASTKTSGHLWIEHIRWRITTAAKIDQAQIDRRACSTTRMQANEGKPDRVRQPKSGKDHLAEDNPLHIVHSYPPGCFVCSDPECEAKWASSQNILSSFWVYWCGTSKTSKPAAKPAIRGRCWGKGFLIEYLCDDCFRKLGKSEGDEVMKQYVLFAKPLFAHGKRTQSRLPFTKDRPIPYIGGYFYPDSLPRCKVDVVDMSTEDGDEEGFGFDQEMNGPHA